VKYWQLPQAVEEVLPEQASAMEALRRDLLDLYRSWGYELVFPPLLEYSDSLLTGLGADLDLLTFKLTDQVTGRTLGIRADITPQVARIDAHSYLKEGVSRLCYAGTTLHTRPKSLMASRCPVQIGAELYGDNSPEADIEIIGLMIDTLREAGVEQMTIDIGHVGVYRAVFQALDLTDDQALFDALQRKSAPDLSSALQGRPEADAQTIRALMNLHGDRSVLNQARELLGDLAPNALDAIDEIDVVLDALEAEGDGIDWYVDLSELRGLNYHTGLVFAAYAKGVGRALANGGRYDDIGEIFGRARAATGFAADLKTLLAEGKALDLGLTAISAPADRCPELAKKIKELRCQGEVVITALNGEHDSRCDRELVMENAWVIRPLGTA